MQRMWLWIPGTMRLEAYDYNKPDLKAETGKWLLFGNVQGHKMLCINVPGA